MAAPIIRQRLSDILAARIQDHISENGLNPGDRLPTEQEMAAEFGVSRLSVREATKALGFVGIIESSPRRGLTVGAFAFERMAPLLRAHPASQSVSAEELLATRVVIETGALPFVLRRMAKDASVYARLKTLNERMQASKISDQWVESDIAFHNGLLRESGLRTLVAFGELLHLFFARFRKNVERSKWRAGADSHLRIINHLRLGNLLAASEELRVHISSNTRKITS